jgi:hypothetical protein
MQKGSKDLTKLDTLFNAYKDKGSEEDVIGPDGAFMHHPGALQCVHSGLIAAN